MESGTKAPTRLGRVRKLDSTPSLAVAFGFFETLGLEKPEKAVGHESPIEPRLAPGHRCALRVSELLGFVAMGNENRW
jgi:hypothetical protein